jgi:hypothetical protein
VHDPVIVEVPQVAGAEEGVVGMVRVDGEPGSLGGGRVEVAAAAVQGPDDDLTGFAGTRGPPVARLDPRQAVRDRPAERLDARRGRLGNLVPAAGERRLGRAVQVDDPALVRRLLPPALYEGGR